MKASGKAQSMAWYAPLLRPVALIAVIAVSAKILQAAAGILLAHRFGATRATDAYILAKSLPIGVYLVFDSLLYNTLVPVYRKQQHPQDVLRAFLGVSSLLCLLLAISLSAGLLLGAPWIIHLLAPGADFDTLHMAIRLCRLMTLSILFALPASYLKSLNASSQRYLLASLDGLVMSATLVATLVLPPVEWGIGPVAGALPASCLMLFTVQLIAARSDLRPTRPAWNSPILAEASRLMLPLVVFNGLHQVNVLSMNAFMAGVGPGAISWLNYSYNVGQIPVSIIDLVLLSTIFPFAASLSAKDLKTFAAAYYAVARLIVYILVPAAAWAAVTRHELIQLVYRHGRFDAVASAGTAACLIGVALAIAPWAFESFACRCLFALKEHGRYARIVAARVALNVTLCALLAPRFGALGVGVAFGLSFLVGAVLSAWTVRRVLGERGQIGPSLRVLPLPASAAALVVVGVHAASIHLGSVSGMPALLFVTRQAVIGGAAAVMAYAGLYLGARHKKGMKKGQE